ncbi:MAG: CheR family methyltransferase [Myxococcota bacterium]
MAFTYFFRDRQSLDLIVEHAVPWVRGRSRVGVWDAGCAMGQEPYSLAILLAEAMGPFAFKNLRILATDLDGSQRFGAVIESGLYPEDQIQRISGELLAKYFERASKPGHYQVVESIRRRVQYRRHDLRGLEPVGEGFCIVVCKNVLLHLHPLEQLEAVRMFHHALAPGGFFCTEQTQALPAEMEPLFERVAGHARLYRKPEKAAGTSS